MRRTPLTALVLFAFLAACGVPQEEHDRALSDLENAQIALADTKQDLSELEEQMEGELATLNGRIEELETERAALQEDLNEAEGDLELYESRAGSLEEALEASREELDELRRARQQTEERLELYRDVASQLASMIEAGQLSVTIRDGRMVINLADDILFDSGRTAIRDEGQQALQDLAEVLQDFDDRSFLVAGHTDDVPISSGRFDSNWELSTARAVEVVQFLQEQGVDPTNLAAAGYGEHDPIASNEDSETRALNRRIEIILMPTIEELPSIPDDLLESDGEGQSS